MLRLLVTATPTSNLQPPTNQPPTSTSNLLLPPTPPAPCQLCIIRDRTCATDFRAPYLETDYLAIVPLPIDLGTIIARVRSGFHRRLKALRHDVELLVHDCQVSDYYYYYYYYYCIILLYAHVLLFQPPTSTHLVVSGRASCITRRRARS
jgi:hypothetical protein